MELTDELCRYYNDFVSPKNLVFEIEKNSAGLVAVNDNVPTVLHYRYSYFTKGDLYQYLVANISIREWVSNLGKKSCRYNSRLANSVWS